MQCSELPRVDRLPGTTLKLVSLHPRGAESSGASWSLGCGPRFLRGGWTTLPPYQLEETEDLLTGKVLFSWGNLFREARADSKVSIRASGCHSSPMWVGPPCWPQLPLSPEQILAFLTPLHNFYFFECLRPIRSPQFTSEKVSQP